MTVRLADMIWRRLGWCPMERGMQAHLPVQREIRTASVSRGRTGTDAIAPGWWHLYRNQLLAVAVAVSVAEAALLFLVKDTSGVSIVLLGAAMGFGAIIGLLFSYEKRYERVVAGEFIRASRTRKARAMQYIKALQFSTPALLATIIAIGVYFAHFGRFSQIPGFMLGASLLCWETYCITVYWEQQHGEVLIAERGSVYTRSMEDPIWR